MKVEGLGKIGAWARCNHLNKLGVANDCAGPLEKRHEVPGFRRNDKKCCFSILYETIKVTDLFSEVLPCARSVTDLQPPVPIPLRENHSTALVAAEGQALCLQYRDLHRRSSA